MRSHGLCVLKLTAVLEIGDDAGCSEGMIADRRHDAGSGRTLADHEPSGGLVHGLLSQHHAVVSWAGAKEPAFAILGDAGGTDVGVQRFSERVMARHLVMLPTFLV